ncbi:MAG: HutD family protein [Planctomycetota bacterium]
MTELRRSSRADARLQPWKNGRGETAEIALWPPGAMFARGDFDWRVSRAALPESGPFSSFPGFDRVLVVVDGDGLHLDHAGAAPAACAAPLTPYQFSGDWPTVAALVSSPVHDFNLLCRRGRAWLRVRHRSGRRRRAGLRGEHVLLHALAGRAEVRGDVSGLPVVLEPFDTLWFRAISAPMTLTCLETTPTMQLVLVQIDAVPPTASSR